MCANLFWRSSGRFLPSWPPISIKDQPDCDLNQRCLNHVNRMGRSVGLDWCRCLGADTDIFSFRLLMGYILLTVVHILFLTKMIVLCQRKNPQNVLAFLNPCYSFLSHYETKPESAGGWCLTEQCWEWQQAGCFCSITFPDSSHQLSELKPLPAYCTYNCWSYTRSSTRHHTVCNIVIKCSG